ncbi:HD domain-containing protein [Chitinimonas sp.]|uniref:HD domain-containing protein n=1 Tax=Chitinimonas sp. TaxID=1934313 RepID=UPI0035AFF2AF
MRLLILGGTRFLGRHLVEAALARGDEVTLFTRGRQENPWGERVALRTGDRDPSLGEGLRSLETGEWDAVIDTTAYVPRIVSASAALLAGRVGQYLLVSSLSAYADASVAGITEDAPLAALTEPESEDISRHYGALKAACEQALLAHFPKALIVRPGLIIGPHDPTDRFSYWPARFAAPHLLGERGDTALLPAPPERPLQWIDVRDLAEWMLHLLHSGQTGSFNAVTAPGSVSFADLHAALLELSPTPPATAWVDEALLEREGLVPWSGLPLWIPASSREFGGFMQFANDKAVAAGLQLRPLADTLRDTLTWLQQRDQTGCWQNVLSAEREQAILQMLPKWRRESEIIMLQSQLSFLLELDKLKGILRKTRPVGLDRQENSAEHSWHVALMAMLLAEHAEPAVDVSRVVKILLLHDIVEIDADDTFLYDDSGAAEKAAKETAAAERLFGMLPPRQASEFMALWREYEDRQTPEGRFAYACDRLLPMLQNLANGGYSWRENQVRFEQVIRKNLPIKDAAPALWQYVLPRLEQARDAGWLGQP